MRKILIKLSAALALCPAVTSRAADFPVKSVTIIVPFAAGGSADILSRGVARGLNDVWGQSIVVENRPGTA